MAVRHGYGKVAGTDALIFAYDTGDVKNSYKGEPTVNLHPNPEDVSSWTGNLFNNWINSAVTTNATIAPDGTLTADRLGDGYGRFNTSVSITAGQTYTYSVYLKNVSLTNNFDVVYAWGLNGTLVSYGTAYNVSIAEISTGKWTRITTTITAPASGVNQVQFGPCPFTGYGNPSGQQLDVWGGQIENKSHATPYVDGTRSAAQALVDVAGGKPIDLGYVSFDSNADIEFDGTNDVILVTGDFPSSVSAYTIEYVARLDSTHRMPIASRNSNAFYKYGDFSWFYTHGGGSAEFYYPGSAITGWGHWVITYDGSNVKVYRNNSYLGAQASSGTADFSQGWRIGYWVSEGGYAWDGKIPVVKIYTRALTQAEVSNNYSFYKNRFTLP